MMRSALTSTGTAALLGLLVAAPAGAQQVFSVQAGYFAVRAEDARVEDDVVRENLSFLLFNIDDFHGGTIGADWLVGVGEFVEAGVGLAYYQRTVPSVYADFVDEDGTDIAQDLKLRIVPVVLSARFFPLTREAPVQPYIGAGLGIARWRYSETGEFVDFRDFSIFRDNFVDEGVAVGPVVVGGVRFPIGSSFSLGGELRYQKIDAELNQDEGFAGARIDLGGLASQVTFQFHF